MTHNPPGPSAVAVATIMNEHQADAALMLGALDRFGQEEIMALAVAAESPPAAMLGAMLELGRRLADEPGSPTAAGWRAYVAAILERRAQLHADAAGLVVEAEGYLTSE